jgi:hypothetical protein
VDRYGGDPMQWLERTPRAVVRAHLRMLPRLAASDSLAMVTRIAAAIVGGQEAQALIRSWTERAGGEPAAKPPESPAERKARLTQYGIKHRRVPKKRADTNGV